MEKKTTAAKPVVKTTAKEASKDTVKEAAVKYTIFGRVTPIQKICTSKRICERDSS